MRRAEAPDPCAEGCPCGPCPGGPGISGAKSPPVDMQRPCAGAKRALWPQKKTACCCARAGAAFLLAAGTQAAAARLLPTGRAAGAGRHAGGAWAGCRPGRSRDDGPAAAARMHAGSLLGAQPPPWRAKGCALQRWAPNGQNLFMRTMPCFPEMNADTRLAAGVFTGAFLPPAGLAAGGVHWPAPRWKHGHADGFAAVPPHGAGRRAGGARHCAAAAAGARAVLLYLCRQPPLACFAEKSWAFAFGAICTGWAGRNARAVGPPLPEGRKDGILYKRRKMQGAAAQFAAGWPASPRRCALPQCKMAAAPG